MSRIRQSVAGGYGRLKLMLVEDNHQMRTIIGSILNSIGIVNVRGYEDPVRALSDLPYMDPDIILLDYQMVPIDGLVFTRRVRDTGRQANPYVPIIMISGHTQKYKVEAARDAGITEYVAKPLTASGLVSRINSVIQTPRPFIRCSDYFGPDRRRNSSSNFEGPFRRHDDRHEIEL